MEKVLLDTDIGSDIDDAACLAYLLCELRCELMGVTTVTGEPEKRAQIASAICVAAGRGEVPIYPGSAEPLHIPQHQKEATQIDALGDLPHQTQFPQDEATAFLRRTIRQHPGEITLLTIAPLTNIARLFALDPEIPRLLRRVVTMGGVFGAPPPGYGATEWNIAGDPHAAAMVFGNRPPIHRIIPLNATAALWKDTTTLTELFAAPPLAAVLQIVLQIGRESVERWGGMVFHDPLAAVCIFHEDVCAFERGTIHLEMEGATAGKTVSTPDAQEPHQIALTCDAARFFARYFAAFSDY